MTTAEARPGVEGRRGRSQLAAVAAVAQQTRRLARFSTMAHRLTVQAALIADVPNVTLAKTKTVRDHAPHEDDRSEDDRSDLEV